MDTEYLKHLVVRTPFERTALAVQEALQRPGQRRTPELSQLYREEGFLRAALRRLISHRSANCVDVGCHLGSTLSQMVRQAPDGRHTAYEAVPHKAAWLRRKFPEVNIREAAVSDRQGQTEFFVHRKKSGFSGLAKHHASDGNVRSIRVHLTTLDNELLESEPPALIKIDVEGNELAVLQGARETIARHRPSLVFESTNSALKAAGVTAEQMFEMVSDELDYNVYTPQGFIESQPRLTCDEFLQAHQYPFRAFNFVATAK